MNVHRPGSFNNIPYNDEIDYLNRKIQLFDSLT